jgi:hypothetical protein
MLAGSLIDSEYNEVSHLLRLQFDRGMGRVLTRFLHCKEVDARHYKYCRYFVDYLAEDGKVYTVLEKRYQSLEDPTVLFHKNEWEKFKEVFFMTPEDEPKSTSSSGSDHGSSSPPPSPRDH